MHICIFAGGAGTRLWPLSRRNSPKQFEKIFGDTSTLQMAMDRVAPFGMENIFISTTEQYKHIVQDQLPELPQDQIYTEPAKRDLAAAVGLMLMRMKRQGRTGTTAILWADHLMDHPDRFRDALSRAEQLIEKDPNRFVFLGEQARFANHNLGWINIGEALDGDCHAFLGWKYRPSVEECAAMFAQKEQWRWNPGYFVFDIDFVLGLYEKFQPAMYAALANMVDDEATVAQEYPTLESLSFDNAIVEHVDSSQAVVLDVDLGWSDPGTLYALKEAMASDTAENYERGNVCTYETKDSLVYNEEEGKLVATVGLDGMVVVNTNDAMIVCPKDRVPEVKKLLQKIEEEGKQQYL